MKSRLTDWASDSYSQFGEDGILEEIFRRIGEGSRTCVEFGAGNGFDCANTARLWRDELWLAVLIEADRQKFSNLVNHTHGYDNVRSVYNHVEAASDSQDSIDFILSSYGLTEVDFMSIDVDGNDLNIWEEMRCESRVVCIEYNRSIPPHISLRQVSHSDEFGQSARAVLEVAQAKGYLFIGMNRGNMFFVHADEPARLFDDLEKDLFKLFPYEDLCYMITDYRGRTARINEPPWGVLSDDYVGVVRGPTLRPVKMRARDQFDSFQEAYGPGQFVPSGGIDIQYNLVDLRPEAEPEVRLRSYLGENLIGFDVSHIGADEYEKLQYVRNVAETEGYHFHLTPQLLTLVKKEKL